MAVVAHRTRPLDDGESNGAGAGFRAVVVGGRVRGTATAGDEAGGEVEEGDEEGADCWDGAEDDDEPKLDEDPD